MHEDGDHARGFEPFQSLFERAGRVCCKELQKALDQVHQLGGGEFNPVLLEFRNYPRADCFSPAFLMFGCRMMMALFAKLEVFAPIPLSYAEAARTKTID